VASVFGGNALDCCIYLNCQYI